MWCQRHVSWGDQDLAANLSNLATPFFCGEAELRGRRAGAMRPEPSRESRPGERGGMRRGRWAAGKSGRRRESAGCAKRRWSVGRSEGPPVAIADLVGMAEMRLADRPRIARRSSATFADDRRSCCGADATRRSCRGGTAPYNPCPVGIRPGKAASTEG